MPPHLLSQALYRRGKARIGKAQKMGRSIEALNILKSAVAVCSLCFTTSHTYMATVSQPPLSHH